MVREASQQSEPSSRGALADGFGRRTLGLAIAACAAVALAAELTAPASVVDGDTLEVEGPDGTVTVHLWGIDAPEIGQPWGEDAAAYLEQLVGDGAGEVELPGEGGSEVTAHVRVEGSDLSEALVRGGHAWLSAGGDTSEELATLLFIARSGGVGMWADDEAALHHPAKWIEENRPRPTPTPVPEPTPEALQRYAQTIAVEGDAEGEVVIGGIPTREVRNREARLLRDRLSSLGYRHQSLVRLRERLERECVGAPEGSSAETDGMFWSERERRWVSAEEAAEEAVEDTTCSRLRAEIRALTDEIVKGKRTAVNQALRFGLSPDMVDREVRRYGLTVY
jgi:endonuclease YncB( thermonuclease family)